jgi:hypothetical protein
LRIAVCSSTLLLPLRDVRGCRLSGRCLTCRALVEVEVARLVLDAPDVTVGQLAARLACQLCGTPPVGVALVEEPAPDAVWLGDDASREGWMPDWVGQWCGPLHPGARRRPGCTSMPGGASACMASLAPRHLALRVRPIHPHGRPVAAQTSDCRSGDAAGGGRRPRDATS